MAINNKSQIGLIGLAVMGQNLVLNLCDHHYRVSIYNRTTSRMQEMIDRCAATYEGRLSGQATLEAFAASLETPRQILIMVKAGSSIDETIQSLLPYLESGDIVIDGGNSYYEDSLRREKELLAKGIHFVGCGVSGGEEGARHGPSIMPGGSEHAKGHLLPILQTIAALDWNKGPCCEWIGPGGSGHFVKMVHNGIEYGDMQLICEVYDLMRRALGATVAESQLLFEKWRKGPLDSYLIDITAQILLQKDESGEPLVDKIVDEAGQKGTGRWTVQEALALGIPLTLVSEAVFARQLTARHELRQAVQQHFSHVAPKIATGSRLESYATDLAQALYAAKVISYAQGFSLMSAASSERNWKLDLPEIARIWSGGCIIRSHFLKDIHQAYHSSAAPLDLLVTDFLVQQLPSAITSLRRVLALAIECGVPVATLSSALAYFDALNSKRLPANLLQAQRDYFGAHTYQRHDRDRSEYFHTDWAKTGGAISSTTYNA